MPQVNEVATLSFPDVADFHCRITGQVDPKNPHEGELSVDIEGIEIGEGRFLTHLQRDALEHALRNSPAFWERFRAEAIENSGPWEGP